MGTGQKSQDFFPHYKNEVSDFFLIVRQNKSQILFYLFFLIIENKRDHVT